MNWKSYWDELARKSNPLAQVARTKGSAALDDRLLDQIATDIAEKLDLQPTDRVLDVCCGNGLLSIRLSQYCSTLTGVDISEKQIQHARQQKHSNLQFMVGDATTLSQTVQGPFDKINLYFSFQYLDTPTKAQQALTEMASLLTSDGKILLGDVPQREKLAVFYPKWMDRQKYRLRLLLGRSHMGRFWGAGELVRMAEKVGLATERIEQPKHLPYHAYRCDYLLSGSRLSG
jgi:ubiquinone/menaquinone biosynthesis C-methylase UbiE